jgi:hypothetical protein
VDNALLSNQVPSFTKIFVSFLYILFLCFVLTAFEVDLATELGMPDVPRGDSDSTKGISFIANLETRKSEERVIRLKDVVAAGGGF